MGLDVYLSVEGEDDYENYSLFDANITHDLGPMAVAAGIYEAVWRPDENGYVYARDIIEVLSKGIELLESDRQRFEKFNASNGWGKYEQFLPWLKEYLKNCKKYPDARITVSR